METTPVWALIIDSAESIVTVVAIVIAGIFAWRNGIIFRQRSPHIDIIHEVTHRAISDSYNHLAVTVELHNTSNVKMEFRDGLFALQRLARMEDDVVEDLYENAPVYVRGGGMNAIQWETIEEIWSEWSKDELSVEPGQTATHTIEFVVPWDIEPVLITTYMFNSRTMGKIANSFDNPDNAPKQKRKLLFWQEIEGPRGWPRVTAHDMVSFEFEDMPETEQSDASQL